MTPLKPASIDIRQKLAFITKANQGVLLQNFVQKSGALGFSWLTWLQWYQQFLTDDWRFWVCISLGESRLWTCIRTGNANCASHIGLRFCLEVYELTAGGVLFYCTAVQQSFPISRCRLLTRYFPFLLKIEVSILPWRLSFLTGVISLRDWCTVNPLRVWRKRVFQDIWL